MKTRVNAVAWNKPVRGSISFIIIIINIIVIIIIIY
jgi:hypothetical protein